jgi:hypothetical protein
MPKSHKEVDVAEEQRENDFVRNEERTTSKAKDGYWNHSQGWSSA